MHEEIYRKQALEQLSSPEHLDYLMPVTRPRAWMALVGVAVLLLVVLIWSMVSTVETTVAGYGLLERAEGVTQVRAPTAGILAKLTIKVNDMVQQGQTIGIIVPSSSSPKMESVPLVAHRPGRVIDIDATLEQAVAEAQAIATVESLDRPLIGVVYVEAPAGYAIQAGTSVRVTPATASPGTGAALSGHVTEAGRYPVTNEMQASGYSFSNRPLLKMRVALASSSSDPEIFSGTPCEAVFIVGKRHPVEYLFSEFGR